MSEAKGKFRLTRAAKDMRPNLPVRIAVVEPALFVRRAVSDLLSECPRLEVLHGFADYAALAAARQRGADLDAVLVTAEASKGFDGQALLWERPRVVCVAGRPENGTRRQGVRLGPEALLEEVLAALLGSQVCPQNRPVSRGNAPAIPGARPSLTPREFAVVVQTCEGFSLKEIASKLGCSIPTVQTHLRRATAKLGVRHRCELVLHAVSHGWIACPCRSRGSPGAGL